MRGGHTAGWCLLLLTALIPGPSEELFHYRNVHLSQLSFSEKMKLALGARHRQSSEPPPPPPVLQPLETPPVVGTYAVETAAGALCIRATMGVQYIVTEKKRSWYFNLDPSRIQISGRCGEETSVLTLTLPEDTAGLQFTFQKENNVSYVSALTAHVSPLPICRGCDNKTYSGLVAHDQLFAAVSSQSFKCMSGALISTSSELKIKLVPLQVQAFSVPADQYGEEVECLPDFEKRVVPIALGAVLVGVALIALLTFLFIRDHRRPGYEQL